MVVKPGPFGLGIMFDITRGTHAPVPYVLTPNDYSGLLAGRVIHVCIQDENGHCLPVGILY